jgi:hypothetical protein
LGARRLVGHRLRKVLHLPGREIDCRQRPDDDEQDRQQDDPRDDPSDAGGDLAETTRVDVNGDLLRPSGRLGEVIDDAAEGALDLG